MVVGAILVDRGRPPARRWQSRVGDLAVAAGAAAAATLPLLMAGPAQLPLLALGLVASCLLAWGCCPRTGSGFLLASAVVFTTVGLVGKQTFLCQWWLIAALVVAGLAMAGGPRPPSRQGMGL